MQSENAFPESVDVTGQTIDLTELTNTQQEYYRSVATHLHELFRQAETERFVVAIAGQSGSGKSVLAEVVRVLLNQRENAPAVYVADIDAFHFHNDYLLSHKDDSGTVLKDVKGRYDTYDTDALAARLAQFHSGTACDFPTYSRQSHNPVPGFHIPKGTALLVVAGLWLLYDHPAWAAVRDHIDHRICIKADESYTRPHAIERHVRGGRSKEDAGRFYETSDHQNTLELAERSVAADETIPMYALIA